MNLSILLEAKKAVFAWVPRHVLTALGLEGAYRSVSLCLQCTFMSTGTCSKRVLRVT